MRSSTATQVVVLGGFLMVTIGSNKTMADVVSYTSTFSIGGQNSQLLTFPRFNPSLGTLTGVSLTASNLLISSISAIWDSEVAGGTATFSPTVRTSLSVSGPGVSVQTPLTTSTGSSRTVAADSDGAPNFFGADATTFNTSFSFSNLSGTSLSPLAYQGVGSVTVTASRGSTTYSPTSGGLFAISVSNSGTSAGTVSLGYTFTPVPESNALLTMASAALVTATCTAWLRRRKTS
jgi:hypothetical protein